MQNQNDKINAEDTLDETQLEQVAGGGHGHGHGYGHQDNTKGNTKGGNTTGQPTTGIILPNITDGSSNTIIIGEK